jgi:hypothetical protein
MPPASPVLHKVQTRCLTTWDGWNPAELRGHFLQQCAYRRADARRGGEVGRRGAAARWGGEDGEANLSGEVWLRGAAARCCGEGGAANLDGEAGRRTLVARCCGEVGRRGRSGEPWWQVGAVRLGGEVRRRWGGEGEAARGKRRRGSCEEWWQSHCCRQNQYMVNSLAPDRNECACTRTRGSKESVYAQANARARGRAGN